VNAYWPGVDCAWNCRISMPMSSNANKISDRNGSWRDCEGERVLVMGSKVGWTGSLGRVALLRDRKVTSMSKPIKSVVECVYCSVLIRVSRLVRGQDESGSPDSERQ
jgi:hypothetical protein